MTKDYLLQCATSDAIIRLADQSDQVVLSLNSHEIDRITTTYFSKQQHNSFVDLCRAFFEQVRKIDRFEVFKGEFDREMQIHLGG